MAAGLLLGGVTVAQAQPGPNGKNDKGLCTAYFNGQKKGHEQGNSPGPFGVLEDDNNDDIDAIFNFCSGVDKGIGGNPEDNGRFPDCFTDDDGEPGNDCTDQDG